MVPFPASFPKENYGFVEEVSKAGEDSPGSLIGAVRDGQKKKLSSYTL